jgi:uncharacterized integral membrane protein (TIGR00698 family)
MEKKRSGLFAHEDYWSIWIGFLIFAIGMVIYFFVPFPEFSEKVDHLEQKTLKEEKETPYKSIIWHQAQVGLNELSSAKTPAGVAAADILRSPKTWKSNPVEAFVKSSGPAVNTLLLTTLKDSLATIEQNANTLHQQAILENFQNENLNKSAAEMAIQWRKTYEEFQKIKRKSKNEGYNLVPTLLVLLLIFFLLFGLGAHFMGYGFRKFLPGFIVVFFLAVLSHVLGQQTDMKDIGFGYAIWAIALGLIISNTIGTPGWVKAAEKPEFYIKTGLVLLGAEILLSKILAIGLPGIFVAWVVTPIVLVVTFWFGQHVLKITSKSLNIVISADMSVCGVSAAIATAAASKATKEELTIAVGLSMVFTSVMMIALPAFIKFLGLPEVLGGAWIGGTIDASGAVVAAGAFLGNTALQVAATIKMIQNMLIGIISFFVAYYWATRVEKSGQMKVGAGEIWKRFPKFIIGFLSTSIVVSIIYAQSGVNLGDALIEQGLIRGYLKDLTGWFFSLAFVSIGLSINFKELKHQFQGGKPMYLYLIGQAFNLCLTLLVAYLMFYVFFIDITEKL